MSSEVSTPTAVQINLHPSENGLKVVPFSHYDDTNRTSTEIGSFVIPWHELDYVIYRMRLVEQHHMEDKSGLSLEDLPA